MSDQRVLMFHIKNVQHFVKKIQPSLITLHLYLQNSNRMWCRFQCNTIFLSLSHQCSSLVHWTCNEPFERQIYLIWKKLDLCCYFAFFFIFFILIHVWFLNLRKLFWQQCQGRTVEAGRVDWLMFDFYTKLKKTVLTAMQRRNCWSRTGSLIDV